MVIRTTFNPDFNNAAFLLADHDNANPRIVNSWELLERILNINYRMHEEDGYPLTKVWVWDPGAGSFSSVKRNLKEQGVRDEMPVSTWELHRSWGHVWIGNLDVGPTPFPAKKGRARR